MLLSSRSPIRSGSPTAHPAVGAPGRATRCDASGVGERTEVINLGFVVADAEAPKLTMDEHQLTVKFLDWADRHVKVLFTDCIALRWQEAERFLDDADRYDSTVLVHDSEWLQEHDRQGHTQMEGRQFRHLKLNFNAAGQLEVLCTSVEVSSEDHA